MVKGIREEIALGKIMKRFCHRFAYKRYPFPTVHHRASRRWKMVLKCNEYCKCDLTWFMSWNYDCKMILIWTLLRSKTTSWWIWTLVFRRINCVCSGICDWIRTGSLVAGGCLTRSFSALYFTLKWGVQRSAVSHRQQRPNGRASCYKPVQQQTRQKHWPSRSLRELMAALCKWWPLQKGRRHRRRSS